MRYTFQVRQVRRGSWTYDLYPENGPTQYSVGECHSRRDAEKQARAACRQEEADFASRQEAAFRRIVDTATRRDLPTPQLLVACGEIARTALAH